MLVLIFLVCNGGNLNIHRVKPVLNSHSKIEKDDQKLTFKTIYCCRSKQSILQYLTFVKLPLVIKTFVWLFLSGIFRGFTVAGRGLAISAAQEEKSSSIHSVKSL